MAKAVSSRNRGNKKKLEDSDNYYGVAWNRYNPSVGKKYRFLTDKEVMKMLEISKDDLKQLLADGMRRQTKLKDNKIHLRDVIDHLLRMEKTHFANKMAMNSEEGELVHDFTPEVDARRINEVKKAQLAILEVDKAKAKVYESDEVIKEVVVAATNVKSAVLALENLSPQLEGKDAGEIRKILKKELRLAMDSLSGYLRESS